MAIRKTHMTSDILFKYILYGRVCIFLSVIFIRTVFYEIPIISIINNSQKISVMNMTVIDLVQDPFFRLFR
jgi:hypothetical protein